MSEILLVTRKLFALELLKIAGLELVSAIDLTSQLIWTKLTWRVYGHKI